MPGRLAVVLGVLVLAALGVAGALVFFNARDDATLGGDDGPGVARVDGARPVVAPGNVVLLFSDERQTAGLRALAEETGGEATPALVSAGQAVIVRRQTGVRVPVVALSSDRRLDGNGYDDPRVREFIEYWLGREAGNGSVVAQHVAAPLRIALAQFDAVVGDVAGNEARIAELIEQARDGGAQLVVFPELALTGYPPEDLLLKEHFLADTREALERLAEGTHGIVALVGYPERAEDVHNSAAILADGALQASYRKIHLPNYGVFDELRYFQPGTGGATIEVDGVTIGVTVCEDIWQPGPPLSDEALAGARLIVNLSASPYHAGKGIKRERMIAQRARDELAAVAFCGLVGGQDELVFDGYSVVVDHDGTVIARAPQFEETLLFADVDTVAAGSARLRDTRRRAPAAAARAEVAHLGSFTVRDHPVDAQLGQAEIAPLLEEVEEVYGALVLGTRDYARKNGFEHVVLGPQRRDRLDARRADRRRRARQGLRDVRDDALAVLLDGHARRCRAARREPRRRAARRCRSSR